MDDALNNDFFINEIDKDYCEFCLNIAKDKTLRDNKYEMIEKFKICVICNKKMIIFFILNAQKIINVLVKKI